MQTITLPKYLTPDQAEQMLRVLKSNDRQDDQGFSVSGLQTTLDMMVLWALVVDTVDFTASSPVGNCPICGQGEVSWSVEEHEDGTPCYTHTCNNCTSVYSDMGTDALSGFVKFSIERT